MALSPALHTIFTSQETWAVILFGRGRDRCWKNLSIPGKGVRVLCF